MGSIVGEILVSVLLQSPNCFLCKVRICQNLREINRDKQHRHGFDKSDIQMVLRRGKRWRGTIPTRRQTRKIRPWGPPSGIPIAHPHGEQSLPAANTRSSDVVCGGLHNPSFRLSVTRQPRLQPHHTTAHPFWVPAPAKGDRIAWYCLMFSAYCLFIPNKTLINKVYAKKICTEIIIR